MSQVESLLHLDKMGVVGHEFQFYELVGRQLRLLHQIQLLVVCMLRTTWKFRTRSRRQRHMQLQLAVGALLSVITCRLGRLGAPLEEAGGLEQFVISHSLVGHHLCSVGQLSCLWSLGRLFGDR